MVDTREALPFSFNGVSITFYGVSASDAHWRFDNSYARLPEIFFSRLNPTPVSRPKIALLNRKLAKELGLDPAALSGEEGVAWFSGNETPPGADSIAQAYAGHQFGHLNMLGDGRAHLLGEHLTPEGARVDIQLKGSGPTPFSRRGDGRAALGPMLREYIISEAMHALGVPTTRSLAVVETGEPVYREEVLPGAVLTRVAASHIRVGTFVYAARVSEQPDNESERQALRTLADYTIRRHYPELDASPEKYLAFLQAVIARQASLIARWMNLGFIHGVMNTDNMAISGETIDYGPCAFMDHYSPSTVFSSIDRNGRYAYGNQPRIAAWNLARFAESLLPLLDSSEPEAVAKAKEAVEGFLPAYEKAWLRGMRSKLGLLTEEADDFALVESLLRWMEKNEADFTNTFRALSKEPEPSSLPFQDTGFHEWHGRWRARLLRQPHSEEESREKMRAHNPDLIPRNHKVEEALAAASAAEGSDLSPVEKLLEAIREPFEDHLSHIGYREPAPGKGLGYQTFCGT